MENNKNISFADEKDELLFVNGRLKELVDADRRVISKKETVGYMLFDGCKNFNIDGHKDLFINSILQISFSKQSKYNLIAGIWDIADDLLVSGLVEKTRTRWGKFIPYIFAGGFFCAVFNAIYWLLPLFFTPEQISNKDFLPKVIAFAATDMLIELFGNFKNVGIGGYLPTITPYPSDRRRLLAISSYFSIIYSRIPDLVVEFTLDFIKNGIVKSTTDSDVLIKKALMIVGPATSLFSGLVISLFAATLAKERVHQKVETPRLSDSLRVVFSHKPILMFMMSNALGSFGTGLSTNDYYRQVLNMTTFETIAGIPSFFFQPIGFSKYNTLAKKFSTRSLYMISQCFAKTFYIPLFFYGIGFKSKNGRKFFQERIPMLPVTAVWECIYATFWGVKNISASEIGNECNDYIEWKCGYRNEAMLSVASTFLCKIPGRINGILQPKYLEWINYDQTAYTEGREQPIKAQYWIFAMATIIPGILVAASMLPMLRYDIDRDTRDRMYRELNERRVATAKKINENYINEGD